MISAGWDHWMVALFIFGAVSVAMLGAAWSQYLDHQRRKQAMDVIKAAIEAGREPPQIIYDQIKSAEQKAPWSEVVVFSALGFGFWIAFAQSDAENRTAFLVVASTMTVTALGCLAIAIMRPGGGKNDDAG